MSEVQQDTIRLELTVVPRWFGRDLKLVDGTDDVYVVASEVFLHVFKNKHGRWDADLYVQDRRIPGTLGAQSWEQAIRETEETALRQLQLWMRVCG